MIDNRYKILNKDWFNKNQSILIRLLNHSILKYPLRKLIHISQDLKWKQKIWRINPDSYSVVKNSKTSIDHFYSCDAFSIEFYFAFKYIFFLVHYWDTVIANTFIPKWNLGFDSIFYPDADPESTSVDGEVKRITSSESWSTIRNGAGTYAHASATTFSTLFTIDSAGTAFDNLTRGVILFDTSSLGSEYVISSADIRLALASQSNHSSINGWGVDMVSSNPASNTALTASDYAYTLFGTTVYATNADTVTGSYHYHSLNSSGENNISLTGISKFGTRINWDTINSYGSGMVADVTIGRGFRTAEQAGTATYAPRLTVVGSGSTNPAFLAMII